MRKLGLFLVAAATSALCCAATLTQADAAGYRASKQTAGEVTMLKGKKKRHAMKARKRVAAYQKRGTRTKRAAQVTTTAAATKRPGNCGTFMYWKDGKCNDARDKK